MALVVAVSVVTTGRADASMRTTQWYTINTAEPPTGSLGSAHNYRFLGVNGVRERADVEVQTYRSVALQHWTLVYPTWPGASQVTGGIGGGCGLSGCPFSDPIPGVTPFPFKLVNRGSGFCLTALPGNGARVVQETCAGGGVLMNRQIWYLVDPADEPPDSDGKHPAYHHIDQRAMKPHRCLNYPQSSPPAQALSTWNVCGVAWFQSFRFLRVDAATCEIGVSTWICGGRKGRHSN